MNAPPLLFLLLLLPLAAIALIWLAPRDSDARGAARNAALIGSFGALVCAVFVVAVFDRSVSGFQFVASVPWMPDLGARFSVGVDGISILFLPATTLLFFCAIVGTRPTWPRARLFFSLVLLLEAATLGVLIATDTLFFFACWELTILPLYFLIRLWGVGARCAHAAAQYALLMLAGGIPLLFGLLMVALAGSPEGMPVFDLATLLNSALTKPLPQSQQVIVFLLLLVGFGVKAPIVPLHTWLPLIAIEGPVAVVALVAGIKLGVYGLVRFAIPLAPQAATELHWLLAGLGVFTLLHGALAALVQTNLRSMLAYLGVSHVGLLLLGLASFSLSALQGVLLMTPNFALAAGGGFLIASYLQARVASCEAQNLGGAARTLPLLATCFLLCGLAGLGLPLTSGFAGEWLVLIAVLQTHTGAGMAALAGVVIGAAAFLNLYRRCFFGPLLRAEVREATDLLPRERGVVLILVLVVLAAGLWPQGLLDLTRSSAEAWLARLNPIHAVAP